jgi:hypothetical protein
MNNETKLLNAAINTIVAEQQVIVQQNKIVIDLTIALIIATLFVGVTFLMWIVYIRRYNYNNVK